MDDTISRQAAIETLDVGAELLRRVLDDVDVVGAERAKYEWGLGLIESYISDMKELASAQPDPSEEDEELDFVQEHKKLPIILETRGKAHWIEVGREEGALGIQYKRLRCSKCSWESSLPIPRKFCPECGSDMRGGQTNV